ncbi:MAG: CpsB/CapC family capsule biosynthesis tyrosine phosphatase [Polyangiaceae bacterium]
MRGYIDLHSHWVAAVDDGAKTTGDSVDLLRALHQAGFSTVVATPHMRPGMFNNTAPALRAAFDRTRDSLPTGDGTLPDVHLSSEHFFDDIVFERLVAGEALPFPSRLPDEQTKGRRSALIEFPTSRFPARITHRIFDLMRRRIRPVIAHPERYEPVWDDIESLDPLLDAGAVLQLDVAALAGRYGRAPRRTAEALLGAGYYHCASSDAHSVRDVEAARAGIDLLFRIAGREEAEFLLIEGPARILDGTVET